MSVLGQRSGRDRGDIFRIDEPDGAVAGGGRDHVGSQDAGKEEVLGEVLVEAGRAEDGPFEAGGHDLLLEFVPPGARPLVGKLDPHRGHHHNLPHARLGGSPQERSGKPGRVDDELGRRQIDRVDAGQSPIISLELVPIEVGGAGETAAACGPNFHPLVTEQRDETTTGLAGGTKNQNRESHLRFP